MPDGAVNTTYEFTATDVITSTKLNNVLDQSFMTTTAIVGGTLEVASGKLKVASKGITSNEMGDGSVKTIAIEDGAVNASKIATGAIIGAVPSNFPIQITGVAKTDVQTITGHATNWTDITGLSLTLTRAVASASGKVRIQAVIPSSTNNVDHGVAFRIVRDTTTIGVGDTAGSRLLATSNTGYAGAHSNIPGVIDFIDTNPGSASTVTYKIQAKMYSAATGYINRTYSDTDTGDYTFRTISTLTLTELSP